MSDPLLYTQGMTDNQRLLFMSEYSHRQKNGTTGVLLALFETVAQDVALRVKALTSTATA